MDVKLTGESPGLASGNQWLPADNGATAAALPATQERRRSPRFECPGTVDLSIGGGRVTVAGVLTNISLHGCYVQTSTTFPLDTIVSLAIDSLGFRIANEAKVRAIYPSTGMGLCFSEMDAQQHAQLELLLKALWAAKHPPR